jgi:hypothetical protein
MHTIRVSVRRCRIIISSISAIAAIEISVRYEYGDCTVNRVIVSLLYASIAARPRGVDMTIVIKNRDAPRILIEANQ